MAFGDDYETGQPALVEQIPEAIVTIGSLSGSDNQAKYIGLEDPLAIWTDYAVYNRYEKDRHVAMLPIASPDGFSKEKVVFCQLTSPTLIWIADWTASRFKEQPKIPDPEPADDNWVLLDEHIEPTMIVVGPDGATPLYRINGTYVYGCKKPDEKLVKNCNYGRPPWLEDAFPRDVDPSKLEHGFIDGTGTAGISAPMLGAALSRIPSPGDAGS